MKGDSYMVVTHWESMKNFEDWPETSAFMEAHANAPPRESSSGPSKLEIHEIIAERRSDH